MNPVQQAINLIGKPLGVVTDALNRPGAEATPHGVARMVGRTPSLSEAVAGKVVLITGASSGIGKSAALRIGASGGTVLLVARGEEKLRETAEEIAAAGGTARIYPCDLTDLEAIDKLVAEVLGDHGGVDILINNAGRSIRRSLELSYDRAHDFERTMQLNYFAAVRLMLGLLPGMRERRFGHVINISSVGVQTKVARFGAYIASKAALDTLSDAFQAETHDENVRFTTVYMSLVRTPMIAPTSLYDNFPTLSPKQAGEVICAAITARPRRVSPIFGRFAAFADAISPEIADAIRNRGFKLFGDSGAAVGQSAKNGEHLETRQKAFVEVTRGVHW